MVMAMIGEVLDGIAMPDYQRMHIGVKAEPESGRESTRRLRSTDRYSMP